MLKLKSLGRVDKAQEAHSGLVVAGSDASELLQKGVDSGRGQDRITRNSVAAAS
jgi:hypothetical protein